MRDFPTLIEIQVLLYREIVMKGLDLLSITAGKLGNKFFIAFNICIFQRINNKSKKSAFQSKEILQHRNKKFIWKKFQTAWSQHQKIKSKKCFSTVKNKSKIFYWIDHCIVNIWVKFGQFMFISISMNFLCNHKKHLRVLLGKVIVSKPKLFEMILMLFFGWVWTVICNF